MKDLIDYIAQIFGLEMKSTIAIMDMENDIGEIQNHAEYVRYLKNGFNLDDIKFLTAYQKFLTLTKRYKAIEVETMNRSRIEQMGSLAERLAQKVKNFDVSIMNHPHKDKLKWEHIKSTDDVNVNYFGEKEVKALSTIGSPLHCIELQRAISGKDALCERLETIFIAKVTQTMAIECKSRTDDVGTNQDVMQLAKNIVKRG
jgi:hypothetical protein